MTDRKARRSPWTRTRDRVIAALIVVAVIAVGITWWALSDSRATVATMSAPPTSTPDAPGEVPATFEELWRASSPATPTPVAEGIEVITGEAGAVVARDPLTGQERWRYARDLELCTVSGAWSKAIAVYRRDHGCSEVTALEADTGRRTAQRNGDAELRTQLLSDGDHVVTTGTRLINVWSQDLVRTMEFGAVPAPVQPERQPRTGCVFGSITVAGGRIGVIERCAKDRTDRLTVIKTTNSDDGETKSDQPKELFSKVLPNGNARVLAITDGADKDALTLVAFGEDKLLISYGAKGDRRAAYPLDLPERDLIGDPDGGVAVTTRTGAGVYWFTGSATIALTKELKPRWTLPDTVGSGTTYAGKLLLPVVDGLAVVDERSGKWERTVAVDRGDYDGMVRLEAIGSVLLEQRGDEVVALR